MSYFKNIKENNGVLTFELHCNGKIKQGLNNAIRRIIISKIPIVTVDRTNVTYLKNTSVINTDILSNRLEFIPWNYSSIKKLDLEKLELRCQLSNQLEEISDILVNQFELFEGNKKLNIKDYTDFHEILFLKLKPYQEIDFVAKFKEDFQKHGGSMYCPTAVAIATYMLDDKSFKDALKKIPKDKQNDFTLENRERFYLKDNDGEAIGYLWMIETVGHLPNKTIFYSALDILLDELDRLVKGIMEKEQDIIQIEPSKTSMVAFDFTIFNEDDTLGNLLQTYLLLENETSFAAYEVVHPLKRNVIIRMATEENNNIDNNKKVFIKTITGIKKLVMELRKAFK